MEIRRAEKSDTDAIVALFDAIHDEEAAGRTTTGWLRGVYPTAAVVETGLSNGDLYVAEDEGTVVAVARLNQEQVDCYFGAPWQYEAAPEQIFVIHTLVVDPKRKGQGIGSAFIRFYEREAIRMGCTVLRLDTNERNTAARRFYARLGYREAGIAPIVFNGIPDVNLVMLEKQVR